MTESAISGTDSAKQQVGSGNAATQKELRCRRVAEVDKKLPASYKTSSPKEELLLQHISEFEQQFISIYGNRYLFLCPPNECGIPKFLPTTVHPCHLLYKELYDFHTCAEFVADFLNYEELKPANQYPKQIPSPASVLKWQMGDCFDFSILLCSMLIGVGYDAYCVSGFAPKFITKRDEKSMKCPCSF